MVMPAGWVDVPDDFAARVRRTAAAKAGRVDRNHSKKL